MHTDRECSPCTVLKERNRRDQLFSIYQPCKLLLPAGNDSTIWPIDAYWTVSEYEVSRSCFWWSLLVSVLTSPNSVFQATSGSWSGFCLITQPSLWCWFLSVFQVLENLKRIYSLLVGTGMYQRHGKTEILFPKVGEAQCVAVLKISVYLCVMLILGQSSKCLQRGCMQCPACSCWSSESTESMHMKDKWSPWDSMM